MKKSVKKINFRVIFYSFIGLGFMGLTFFVDWIFIIGAAVMMLLSQQELKKK